MRGATREEVIKTIQSGNAAINLPEIDIAVVRSELLDVGEPIDLLGPLKQF